MPWPSTKAQTTHLDAQTDDPNLARPEIKQNIDNVNDIIDFFPSGNLNLKNVIVVLELSGGALSSGFNTITEHSDEGSLCTVVTSNKFTLSSGKYVMNHEAIMSGTDSEILHFFNNTTSSNVVSSNPVEIGTYNTALQLGLNNTVFDSNGSDQFAFKYSTYTPANSADPRDGLRVKFTKIG